MIQRKFDGDHLTLINAVIPSHPMALPPSKLLTFRNPLCPAWSGGSIDRRIRVERSKG